MTTKTPKYNISYQKAGATKPELFMNCSILGCYTSNDSDNEGYMVWSPERNDYRNFNYYRVKWMEVAT